MMAIVDKEGYRYSCDMQPYVLAASLKPHRLNNYIYIYVYYVDRVYSQVVAAITLTCGHLSYASIRSENNP